MKTTHILTLTLRVYSDGAIRLGWREWSETRRRKKSFRKDLKSMNFFSSLYMYFSNLQHEAVLLMLMSHFGSLALLSSVL